ncbi:MAG: type II secretion system protein [Akkermansia sp.]
MRTTFSPRLKNGFTLVELLVVITIIIALAGVAFVTANKAMNTARERKSQSDCANLALGINNFIADHMGILPVEQRSEGDGTVTTDVDDQSRLITILLGREKGNEMDNINKTKKKYISGSIVDQKRDGIYFSTTDAGYYDAWGHPYFVIMDSDEDEEIADPTNPKKPIFSRVVVYGMGMDGIGSQKDGKITNKEATEDNVYSWKKK